MLSLCVNMHAFVPVLAPMVGHIASPTQLAVSEHICQGAQVLDDNGALWCRRSDIVHVPAPRLPVSAGRLGCSFFNFDHPWGRRRPSLVVGVQAQLRRWSSYSSTSMLFLQKCQKRVIYLFSNFTHIPLGRSWACGLFQDVCDLGGLCLHHIGRFVPIVVLNAAKCNAVDVYQGMIPPGQPFQDFWRILDHC